MEGRNVSGILMAFHSRNDIEGARRQAQANADEVGIPYIVFRDTSGNIQVERQREQAIDGMEVIRPTLATYPVRLTEDQIRLVRQLISEKHLLVKSHPMPEDGNLAQRLCDLDKPFHAKAQCF